MAKKGESNMLRWVLLIILLIGTVLLYLAFGPNTGDMHKGEYVYIHTGATYEDVKQSLVKDGFINNIGSFELLAKAAKYPTHVRAGKYKINKGMSNYNMVRLLRSGKQTPVKLVINKLRTRRDFARLVGKNLEADSNQALSNMSDNAFLAEFGLDSNTAMCAIMPDTYEFFWNTDADKTFRKIAKSYTSYWNAQRKQEAAAKGLTQQQVVTMASIIDEETNLNEDKPKIASVYLNRLKNGVRLQADPTVKFALGDFSLRRITGVHLQVNSPYNTYIYPGLPPGPICTPAKSSIEAVLHAPATQYMYFVAKEDFSGYSVFANTLAEHQQNARRYQQALNARGIH